MILHSRAASDVSKNNNASSSSLSHLSAPKSPRHRRIDEGDGTTVGSSAPRGLLAAADVERIRGTQMLRGRRL
uniref:Uncharacterized protein MANES_10G060900 n=1 Tax=Rhizophora mucronata TaxID=61149 RepID=A0A2P2M0D4_RHIMU